MDLDHYRNFITIVESGSLTEAAKKLHIAQPALSNQIKNLQRKYNIDLIITKQGIRRIELTEAGHILYKKAKYLCALEDTLIRDISNCNDGSNGTLRISLSPSLSIPLIQKYLSDFSRLYPQVRYELYEVPITEQTDQLLNGVTEIGITNTTLQQVHLFKVVNISEEDIAAVYHEDSAFHPKSPEGFTLEELSHYPVAINRGCEQNFLEACAEQQITPNILSFTTTKTSALMWAYEKNAVAIVPWKKPEMFHEGLIYAPITNNSIKIHQTVVVAKDSRLSKVAENFIQYYLKKTAVLNASEEISI